MIYIFDDRAQRREDNEEKLSRYSDRVRFMKLNLMPDTSLENALLDNLSEPECVLFHKSYPLANSNVTVEDVRDILNTLEIPVVIFSGGIEGNNKGSAEITMNSVIMYENLPFFIDNLKETGKPNFDTLIWGERYELNAILNAQNKLAQKYLINNNPADPINIRDVTRTLNQTVRKLHSGFAGALNNAIEGREDLTWGELADIIDRTVQNYI